MNFQNLEVQQNNSDPNHWTIKINFCQSPGTLESVDTEFTFMYRSEKGKNLETIENMIRTDDFFKKRLIFLMELSYPVKVHLEDCKSFQTLPAEPMQKKSIEESSSQDDHLQNKNHKNEEEVRSKQINVSRNVPDKHFDFWNPLNFKNTQKDLTLLKAVKITLSRSAVSESKLEVPNQELSDLINTSQQVEQTLPLEEFLEELAQCQRLQANSPSPRQVKAAPVVHRKLKKIQTRLENSYKGGVLTSQTESLLISDAIVRRELLKLLDECHDSRAEIYKKYSLDSDALNKNCNIPDSNDKELMSRLETLEKEIQTDLSVIVRQIQRLNENPLYKYMGCLKFISFLAASNAKVKNIQSNLSELERIAIYGYTTGDYKIINTKMRWAGEKSIKNPGIKAYIEYACQGLKKLPDIEASKGPLKRAIFEEPRKDWGCEVFAPGKIFKDFAFSSCTLPDKFMAQGIWNLSFETKNAKNIAPYSAWEGESEILILPGTSYRVKSVNGSSVELEEHATNPITKII